MSQQLRFSATISVLTMALFALTASVGGLGGASGVEPLVESPRFASATLGR